MGWTPIVPGDGESQQQPSASALVRVLIDGKAHDLTREQAKKLLDDIRQAIGEPERLPPLSMPKVVPTTAPRPVVDDWDDPEKSQAEAKAIFWRRLGRRPADSRC